MEEVFTAAIKLIVTLIVLAINLLYRLVSLLCRFTIQAIRAYRATHSDSVIIGHYQGVLGCRWPYAIPRSLRTRHVSATGATGSGKSVFLRALVGQDADAGHCVIVVDVKDDLCFEVAKQLPPHRVGDAILFSPLDRDFPPALNPLANVPKDQHTLATAELLSAFERLYQTSWGPRIQYILRFTLLSLLQVPGATLLDVRRILVDGTYRASVIEDLDPPLRSFWQQEFPGLVGSHGSLVNLLPVISKLAIFSYPELANVIGQPERGLDLNTIIAERKILLVHLPQGLLGEEVAFFLAALFSAMVQLAAQRRVALPAAQRHPVYACFDEFQNYVSSAFEKILTEGRSMGLGICTANQYPEQLPETLRLAVAKNVAHQVSLARLENGRHIADLLTQPRLANRQPALRLWALPPPAIVDESQLARIRAQSRATLAKPRAEVEAEIAKRYPTLPDALETPPARRKFTVIRPVQFDEEAGRAQFTEP